MCAGLLTGCGAATAPTVTPPAPPGDSPAMTATAPPATAGGSVVPQTRNWFELEVGDCVTALPQLERGDVAVPLADCAGPHVAQVFLRVPVEVNSATSDVAEARCRAALAAYTAGGQGYSLTYLIDSNQDRTSNAPLPSTVICLLQSAGGEPLVGSAAPG